MKKSSQELDFDMEMGLMTRVKPIPKNYSLIITHFLNSQWEIKKIDADLPFVKNEEQRQYLIRAREVLQTMGEGFQYHNTDCLVHSVTWYIQNRLLEELLPLKERVEVLAGFKRVCIEVDIEELINIIKHSFSRLDAVEQLCDKYNFSTLQAKAILDLKLKSLIELPFKFDRVETEIASKEWLLKYVEQLMQL